MRVCFELRVIREDERHARATCDTRAEPSGHERRMGVDDRDIAERTRKERYRKTVCRLRGQRKRRYANHVRIVVAILRHRGRDEGVGTIVDTERVHESVERRDDSVLDRSITLGKETDAKRAHDAHKLSAIGADRLRWSE